MSRLSYGCNDIYMTDLTNFHTARKMIDSLNAVRDTTFMGGTLIEGFCNCSLRQRYGQLCTLGLKYPTCGGK